MGAFRLGGDVDAAFDNGVERIAETARQTLLADRSPLPIPARTGYF